MINICVIVAVAMNAQMFCIALVFTGELFPTPVRNVADSFQQVFTRVGSMISPHVFWTTSEIWTSLPFLFLSVLIFVNLLVFDFLIPETKGHPMSDHMPDKSERIFKRKSKINESSIEAVAGNEINSRKENLKF